MVEGSVVDQIFGFEMECLWFCFFGLLQKILDEVKEYWNIYCILGFRYDIVRGRLDLFYYLFEFYGVIDQFLLFISEVESGYVCLYVIESDYDSDYQEYFKYVCGFCGFKQFNDWK